MRSKAQPPSDQHCMCCGRTHRVLVQADGYWLGRTCAKSYAIYQRFPQPTALVWQGYERQYAQCKRMATLTSA